MSRLPYLSSISVLALCAGCPPDTTSCGPDNAPASGIVAGNADTTLTYGMFEASINNDCPADAPPEGIISMTIDGKRTDGIGLITLCVQRPDLFAARSQKLGPDVKGSEVHVVDVSATIDNCEYTVDPDAVPTGTADAIGMCGANGDDPAGFALELDGAVGLLRVCNGGQPEKLELTLTGKVAVVSN